MADPKEITKKIPLLGFLVDFLGESGADYGWFIFWLSAGLFIAILSLTNIPWTQVMAIVVALSPIWLTWVIFLVFFNIWTTMVGKKFYLYNGRTLLRIRLPQEIFKSPEAMEFVISQVYNNGSPDNLMQTYIDGKRPLPYSFEIVSIGGDVRFYANLPTRKTKAAFEAHMYAQYPGIEVVEEPVDYAAEYSHEDISNIEFMSFQMKKRADQELPIKTYIDYKMDTLPKEEEKLDPITPLLELMSTIRPFERLYVQIIATPYRVESFKYGQLKFGKSASWETEVHKKINEMMNRDPNTRAPKEGIGAEEMARLTQSERDTIAAMERNASKTAYDTGIRWIYISKKGEFNGDLIGPMLRAFSQFDIIGRNTIGLSWRTDINYKDWIPGSAKKIMEWKKAEFKEYKLRKLYQKSGGDGTKIFTVEELATMWHIPGKVAITPNLSRIQSLRGEAPPNLPIGELPS